MWPFELHSPLFFQQLKQTRNKSMAGVVLLSSGCSGGPSSTTSSSPAGVGCGGDKNQLSLVALLLAAIRRSMVSCRMDSRRDGDVAGAPAELGGMDIGWPTDVRHVAHVTFDRFNGFLGLPVELEHEVPGRVPSASASVFGVSAESMQCCYDSKGNSVPTILLLMQERLYTQGGLKAEGIFRINPENSQEEQVRQLLNRGIVPDDIDVHCLAGLIKAWFRELPEGVLDGLSPEQVLQCNTEEEFVELVKLLLPTPAALLNWAVNLMADVVEEEEMNKMNARNIAMVFAPNMTQMSDPLTALMHAVQVMNLLKALILKTLREREDAAAEGEYSAYSSSPSSEQQGEDDLDSEKAMDMSGELKEVASDDCMVNYCDSSQDDEDDAANDIEDCFLKRLEWKGHVADLIRDSVTLDFYSSDQTTQWTYSDLNVGSGLLLSEHESSRTSNNESHAEAKSKLECKEGGQVEMVEATSETSKLALCLDPC